MDDGIELNFAVSAPASGAAGGRQMMKKKQGGNWTERMKANKAAKQRIVKATPLPLSKPSPAPAPKPSTSSAPAPRPSAPSPSRPTPTSAPAPRFTLPDVSSSRPGPSKPSNLAPKPRTTANNSSNLTSTSLPPLPTTYSQMQAQAHSGSQSQAQGSAGQFQIISSLFSSNPTIASTSQPVEEDEPMPSAAPSNAPTDTSTFEGLGLDPLIINHLSSKLGISRPTRIQRAALIGLLDPTPLTLNIPPTDPYSPATHPVSRTAQEGRDAFIQSQTGSGKTLSYLLPVIQSLLPLATRKGQFIDRSVGTLAIILAPTRELARQISEVVDDLLRMAMHLPDEEGDEASAERKPAVYQRYMVSGLLTGGSTRTHEKSRLRRGCPILVCTPGRLLDHLQNTQSFRVDKLMWLVLDEADRLVEEGFGETLKGIMKALEGRRNLGMEAEKEGVDADKRREARAKGGSAGTGANSVKVADVSKAKMPKIEGFDDSDSDDDDDWDYETMGAKPKAGPSSSSKAAPKAEITLPQSTKTLTSSSAWPYWHLGRRTVLCSATVSGEVQKLAGVALKDPVMFRGSDIKDGKSAEDGEQGLVAPAPRKIYTESQTQDKNKEKDVEKEAEEDKEEEKFTPPSQLDQRYVVVPAKLRLVTLVALLRSLIAKATAAAAATGTVDGKPPPGMKVIVFMSCTDSVDFHWRMFGGVKMAQPNPEEEGAKIEEDTQDKIGFSCPLLPSTSIYRLHGSLPLQTRRSSLSAFAAASAATSKAIPADLAGNNHSILLCTSVASRGLDLPLVRAVVQYDLPTEQGVNEYVHRVGRTARVGKGGESWAIVGDKEVDWVGWVEEGMNKGAAAAAAFEGVPEVKKKKKLEEGEVRLRQVGVEDVLKRGFVPKGGMKYEREYESRATQVQLAFERWVLESDDHAALARQAFSSSIRAYSTHPSEEKRFFHVRNLHLGHVAKAFGLRETPGKIGGAGPKAGGGSAAGGKGGKQNGKGDKRKRGQDDDGAAAGAAAGPDEKKQKVKGSEAAVTETERRMYEAVRKQGRLTKSGGAMGVGGTGGKGKSQGGEFQVAGTDELERLVKRKL